MDTNKFTICVSTLCLVFFLVPYSGNTEESAKNNLPSSPDTGSPEEDFSAGGSRGNNLLAQICGENSQQIAYLLGENNREFTSSPYPTFWFHIPQKIQKLAQIKFSLTDLETDQKIYHRTLKVSEKSNIVGISLPAKPQYALSPAVNYSWRLEVDCTKSEDESVISLEGWLQHLPLSTNLRKQLATVSIKDRYKVYLRYNLLYDALSNLAQRHIVEPDNSGVAIAWNRLLTELGWQDLVGQSAIQPSLLDTKIVVNNYR